MFLARQNSICLLYTSKVNINNTPKQTEYKNKQWKKPDREHNSSKLGSHKVATIAKGNIENENGQKNV